MAELGLPFQGSIWYWIEGSFGGGESGTTYAISCKVQDVRIGIGDKHKELRGINSPCACELLEQVDELTLHIEYIPQTDDVFLTDVGNRTQYGKLNSLAFCIGANVNVAGATDKTYWYLLGAKSSTKRISSSFNNEYIIAVDFIVKSGTTSTSARGSAPADLTGAYCAFNISGSINKDGADIAYITDSIDITIDDALTPKYDHDSKVCEYIIEGKRTISGSCDISLDEGGGYHWSEIMNQKEFDIVVDLATTAGSPRITLPNCKWKSGEFDINISDEPMMDSAPFTSHPSLFSECTNVIGDV